MIIVEQYHPERPRHWRPGAITVTAWTRHGPVERRVVPNMLKQLHQTRTRLSWPGRRRSV